MIEANRDTADYGENRGRGKLSTVLLAKIGAHHISQPLHARFSQGGLYTRPQQTGYLPSCPRDTNTVKAMAISSLAVPLSWQSTLTGKWLHKILYLLKTERPRSTIFLSSSEAQDGPY